MRSRLYVLSLVLSLGFASVASGQTASLPSGFYLEEVAPGASFNLPVGLEFAPDGRTFIAEKGGIVWVVENGVKLPTPFIDLSDEVLDHLDRGLLGMTLHPDFEQNGYVYLLYTIDRENLGDHKRFDAVGRLTRYTVSNDDPNVIDETTRHVIIGETYAEGIPACYYSHAAGTVLFGHDGSLLISAGDGAWYSGVDAGGKNPSCFVDGLDPAVNDVGAFRAQALGSLAGKILRIDPETGEGLPDNPFFTGNPADTQSKVWSLGFRNPYRFSIAPPEFSQHGGPGTLYVADVGWLTWEEINVLYTGGENFGWPCYEGNVDAVEYQAAEPAHSGCNTLGEHKAPKYWFKHQDASQSFPSGLKSNAIVIGDVYRGTRYPSEYRNRVFYADYTRGWVASAAVMPNGGLDGQWVFGTDMGPVVEWRYNPYDEYFYYLNVWTGTAMRVRHNDENRPPIVVASSNVTAGLLPLQVDFSSTGTYDPDGDPVRVVWSFGDGTKTKFPNPSHTYTDAGTYTVTATAYDDSGASSSRTWTISAGNTMPQAIAFSPNDREVVTVDDVLNLFGIGQDEQDLPKHLDYSWHIISRHNNHYHPNVFSSDERITSYQIEEHGVPEEVNYLEVNLVVTDTGGLRDTTTRYVEIRRDGELDVTALGEPIAVGNTNDGDNQQALARLGDGVMIEPGSASGDIQFDTRGVADSVEHWIGYAFPEPTFVDRLEFQEGEHTATGGWFEDLRVEVLAGGEWSDVAYLSVLTPYAGDASGGGKTYSMQFLATFADAIRVIGAPGGSESYITAAELRAFALPAPKQNRLETVVVGDVAASEWTTVGLRNNFGKMVVVCAPVNDDNAAPVTVRIRRATGSSFDVMLQSVDPDATVVPEDVHCTVTSSGVWQLPDGSMLQAGRYEFAYADSPSSLVGEEQLVTSSIEDPVVIGQVMSYNDPRFLSFWSRGADVDAAPTNSAFFTGVFDPSDAEEPPTSEMVAYIAVERGHADAGSFAYSAGSTTVSDLTGTPTAAAFDIPFAEAPGAAFVSAVGAGAAGPAVASLAMGTMSSDSIVVAARSLVEEPDSLSTRSVHFVAFGSAAANYQLQIPTIPTLPSTSTAAKSDNQTPDKFAFTGIYPNPFEHSVTIGYSIPDTREIIANVYDVLGRHVATVDRGEKPAGYYEVSWTGKTGNGAEAAPGVYLLVLKTSDGSVEQKLVKSR